MPQWYIEFRFPLLLLQSVLGVLPFAYSLHQRERFLARSIGGTAACMLLLYLVRVAAFGDPGLLKSGIWRGVMIFAVYFVLIALCCFVYEETFWTALFVASSGYIAQDIAGTLKTFLKLIPFFGEMSLHPLGILFVDLIAYIGLYVLLYYVFRPFTQDREVNFGNSKKAVFSALVLLFCVGMARLAQDNADRSSITVVTESIYQILCGVFILLMQFGVMERARLSRSVDTMRELIHEQHNQFRQSKEALEIVNEKYHDLKGLLEGYGGQISKEQMDALKAKVGKYDILIDTGSSVLDIVIAEKRAVCNQRGIELTTLLDGTELGFMEELDLYSLFSNTLNNAIDAVSRLPEGARFITLTASSNGGFVTIHAENPYSGEVVMENGLPKSQREGAYHGFGMKSMKRIAEKYGGTLAVKSGDGIFHLDILLFDAQPVFNEK